jgi:hypothetical protein
MTVDDIIERLGGRQAIARMLGVSRTAPYNWARGDGIPARHWPDLVARAAELGVKGVSFDVLRATGPKWRLGRERRVTPDSKPVRKSSTSRTSRERRIIETAANNRSGPAA